MKRSLVLGLAFAAAGTLVALFGGMQPSDAKPAPAATPSSRPSALPTATPEPPDKAIPRLLSAIKKNPNDKQSLSDLAQQYIGVGRADLALPLTQKLLALGDRTAQTYYFDGYANEQLNRIPQAIADYENASNVDPTNVGVLGSLTSMYLKTNRFTDAERVAKRSVTFNKTDRRSFINLGLVYASEKKFSDARDQFETAYKMDSSDITPLLQIGQTYVGANDNANALVAINRAIAADPKNPDAQLFKADLYAKQHDVVNALAAYELAVQNAPDDDTRAQIAVREAAFLALEKKNSDAEAAFIRAIATYPNSLQPHLAYGDYWNSQNQIQKAVDQWNLALGPNKDNPAALVRLATYNMRTGHAAQALPYLKSLAQADPSAQVLAMLGQAYTSLHDYTNAKRACEAAYQSQPNPDSLGCVAGADFELKNYKESAAIFDVLDSRVHPFLDSNPQLLFIAAKVYESQKQPAKAVVEYGRLLKIMKPGTADYKKIQASIASLKTAKPAKKHG
ncbi:MAG: tetratricopeptide repeat protein [Candidatus Eremiobacteraeota bacterium]|nr:tetratricopeptide repeat protein [Candidatus Eremiobacteraeota bacterium]